MSIRTKFTTFSIVAALGCGMVSATVPAALAAPGSVSAETAATHVYEDGASLQFPSTWTVGQPLYFTGTGFTATDGSPSILAVKINGGPVSGARYLEIKADANGNVSGSIPWQENLKAGESIDINVLTGSLNKKDRQRGGVAATVTVVNGSSVPSIPKDVPSGTPSPSEKPNSVPSESPSIPAPNPSMSTPATTPSESPSATPSETTPSQQPSVTPSESPSASVTASVSANAEVSPTPRFRNCKDVQDAGLAPIDKSHPDFQEKFDADHDGKGCEQKVDYENSTSRVDSSGEVVANHNSNNNNGGGISGQLASTGAAGVVTIASLGLVAVGAGVAAIVVMRRRKRSS